MIFQNFGRRQRVAQQPWHTARNGLIADAISAAARVNRQIDRHRLIGH